MTSDIVLVGEERSEPGRIGHGCRLLIASLVEGVKAGRRRNIMQLRIIIERVVRSAWSSAKPVKIKSIIFIGHLLQNRYSDVMRLSIGIASELFENIQKKSEA